MDQLPLLPPRMDALLWPSHRLSSNYFDAPATENQGPASDAQHRRPTSHHGHAHDLNSSRSLLAQLATDEKNIYQRKQNVRKFGAGWLRPPGVAKTFQAQMDEDVERAEQEALAHREQVLMDLAAAQTDAQNQEAAAEGEDQEMGERDLDDDVPEATLDNSDLSAEDASGLGEGDIGVDRSAGDLTFNEDSFIEGSMVEAEVEHMLEMEEAEISGILQEERDLDDSIPEAGSYEHTETDLSVDSSEDGEVSLGPRTNSSRRRSTRGSGTRARRAMRSSIDIEGSSSIALDGSSFLRSSPVAARGSLRSRFAAVRGARGG
ncbi:hypothetical protein EJ04DRAFT_494221 [Polyplosphaeria fusca]|uniref:Apc15p protein-domain-containing protein n=1 Tax=Polyplosphaeria fusca TaxID=682080 RepID=A0A9P4QUJ2_9PLEO|nr:hypothetical protein EJ04DRAFT_494221 [Polyplosphaeria fusca]